MLGKRIDAIRWKLESFESVLFAFREMQGALRHDLNAKSINFQQRRPLDFYSVFALRVEICLREYFERFFKVGDQEPSPKMLSDLIMRVLDGSKGKMLSAMGEVKGSAGYVAMERVTGTPYGKRGTFVLQHTGIMNRGVASLSVTVVADCGTGELKGLTGKMNIIIAEGKHSYEFDYAIAE